MPAVLAARRAGLHRARCCAVSDRAAPIAEFDGYGRGDAPCVGLAGLGHVRLLEALFTDRLVTSRDAPVNSSLALRLWKS
ncbi:unnamed protein product [Lampetra planeri]